MTDITDDIAEEMSFQSFEDDCRLLQSLLNDVLQREVGSKIMERVERTLTLAQVLFFFCLFYFLFFRLLRFVLSIYIYIWWFFWVCIILVYDESFYLWLFFKIGVFFVVKSDACMCRNGCELLYLVTCLCVSGFLIIMFFFLTS